MGGLSRTDQLASRPHDRRRRAAGQATAAVLVLAGSFAVGSMVSRIVTEPASSPVTPIAGSVAEPAPSSGPMPSAGPASSVEPAPSVVPTRPASQRPATADRLPLGGFGPYGTSSVTGTDLVALTFDDGPDPRWTPEVLELLRHHRITATFCVVGELVAAYPQLVREIVADGHTLCNHSWRHDNRLGSRTRAAIRADLERTIAAIRDAVPDAPVAYYRQPGGMWTERVVEVAEELGMEPLHWAVDPQDWRQTSVRTLARAVAASPPGAIVLLHDGGGEREVTVSALRLALPELVSRYEVAALPPDGRSPLPL